MDENELIALLTKSKTIIAGLVNFVTELQETHAKELEALEENLKNREREIENLTIKLEESREINKKKFPTFPSSLAIPQPNPCKSVQIDPKRRIHQQRGIMVKSYTISWKRLVVEEIMEEYENPFEEYDQNPLIGGNTTYLAVKDQRSYMMGTYGKGIKLVEDDVLVYHSKLSSELSSLKDIIYIESLDYYLLSHNDQISRKNIDSQPPYVYLEVPTCSRRGSSFRFSKIHNSIVINKSPCNIIVINLENKEVDMEITHIKGNQINDFRVFGRDEEKIAAITADGNLSLFELDYYDQKSYELDSVKQDLFSITMEYGLSLAVCNEPEHIIVEFGTLSESCSTSRMVVFQVVEDRLVKKSTLFANETWIRSKHALGCFGLMKNHIVWVAVAGGPHGVVQIFDYNLQSESLSELKEMRMIWQKQKNPVKLVRFGDQLYYTGEKGVLMSISFKR